MLRAICIASTEHLSLPLFLSANLRLVARHKNLHNSPRVTCRTINPPTSARSSIPTFDLGSFLFVSSERGSPSLVHASSTPEACVARAS